MQTKENKKNAKRQKNYLFRVHLFAFVTIPHIYSSVSNYRLVVIALHIHIFTILL